MVVERTNEMLLLLDSIQCLIAVGLDYSLRLYSQL